MAEIVLGRLKFKWKGPWVTATAYIKDDVVRFGGSSYVCVTNHTAGTWATDLAAVKWQLMIEGATPTTTLGDISYRGSSQDQRLPIGTAGQALMVSNSGIPAWTGLVEAQNVYYVSEDGSDANDGKNLNKAFKTIRYACSVVTGPAVIFVKTGVYNERLPIVVPPNVSVYGDGQRTTEVQPINISSTSAVINATSGAATSTTITVTNANTTGNEWQVGAVITGTTITGTVTITAIATSTPSAGFTTLTVGFTSQTVSAHIATVVSNYSTGTMWQLSTASMLHKMFFSGMTGFTPSLSAPEDIREANIAGVYVAFNPASPITTKSPYVLECSCFSDGGIGAIVDGTVHASGYKSMVFHAYTCINSDGVGFWVNGDGKAEIVSCFTYFNWFGYTTTNGGKIRSLNGNNSYGRYGAVSKGFDVNEATLNGTIYGDQLDYTNLSLVGEFSVGTSITGSSSGAIGTITNVQTAAHKIYYKITSGTFTAGETITGGNGATAAIATGGVTGQKGFVLILTGLTSEPKIGGSIEFNTGDTSTYVIQSVSGAYVNSSSRLAIVLAGEKVTPSVDGTGFKIRYNFSQTRLQGHDFLNIGTGNRTQTNYPGVPTIPPSQANEVIETFPGRVFYVSTDQDGNFRVGDYFKVDQATGRATLNANAFDLSGLTSLRLGSIGAQLGELVNEFSSDDTLSGNSNQAVPTEAAVRNYFPHVATDIIPGDDNSRNLGSPSKRWAHVYVGPGSVTIGTLTLTDVAGTFTVNTDDSTPAKLSVPELNTGSVRYFQNNIIGTNSNEDIVIDTSGTGKLQVLTDINMTGTLSGPATFTIDPAAVGDNTGLVVIKGNLQVDGTTTTINSTTLSVADKNIVLAEGSTLDSQADGAGITVKGATDKTLNWVDATDAWTSSEDFNLLTGKSYEIAGTSVLNATTLGSGVTASSLTSVGTLSGGLNIASSQTYKINTTDVLSASVILGSAATPTLGGNSTTGITLGGTGLTTVQIGSNTSAANTVTIGGAITGNTLKIAGTSSGTTTLSSDVTTGTLNLWSGVTTGTVNFGTGMTTGSVNFGSAAAGRLSVAFNQTSSSTTTGAVTIAGGLGVAGSVYAGAVYDSGARVASTGKAIAMAMVFG